MRFIVLLTVACFGCLPAFATPPNIIFILADDLGYADLGCYGQKMIETPNLDRMAAEGMRFTQAYAGATVCAPSRSVLMTGQHGGRTRVRANAGVPLLPEDVTPAEVLKGKGYRTALIGKWGIGEEGTTGIPNKQGFDYFYGYLNQLHAHNHFPSWLWRNEEKVTIEGNDEKSGGVCGVCTHNAQELLTEEALGFMGKPDPAPFFVYLAYVAPHANNERGYIEKGNGMEVPDYGQYADKDWPDAQKGQAAMVSRLDRDVGRLLDWLKSTGKAENTIVFFASDNGVLNEGGGDAFFFNSSGPLQGHKRSLHDGGVRTPFLAWGPGRVPAGQVTEHVTAFDDFLPTVAELSGAETPPGLTGVSIAPTLLGKEGQAPRDYFYWEFHEGGFYQAIRKGNWKGIRYNLKEFELFDLAQDIGEANNIAAEHPQVVAELTALLDAARTESEHFPMRISERRPRSQP